MPVQDDSDLKIKTRHFLRRKYGKDLLIDCSLYSQSNSILPEYPFTTDFYSTVIVTGGSGSIVIDGSEIHFSRGTLLFIQPNQIRHWRTVSPDFDAFFLVFENEFTETFFQDSFFIYRFQFFHNNAAPSSLKCGQEFTGTLVNLCREISIELAELQDDSHHLLRAVLYYMLIRINREYIVQNGLSAFLFQDNPGIRLKKLLEVEIKNYKKVEDYARLMKVSRSHLNHISKKAFGLPASAIIKQRILIEIKRELLFTHRSVKEICFHMNYSDVSNFVRFFKKQTGMNPGEYRLKYTK